MPPVADANGGALQEPAVRSAVFVWLQAWPALGALLHLPVLTRPDLLTAVHLLAQEMESPAPALQHGADRAFRYLNCTRDYGLLFSGHRDTDSEGLVAYGDAAFDSIRCLLQW